MSVPLTEEQRARIEENRKKALERLAAKSQSCLKEHSAQNFFKTNPVAVSSRAQSFYSKPTSSFKSNGSFLNGKPNGFKSTNKFSKCEEKPNNWTVLTDVLTGTCSLIGRNRFSLDIGYNAKVIDIAKSIPGKQYDATRKNWNFPLEEYDNLKAKLAPLSPNIVVGNIPKSVMKLMKGNQNEDYKNVDLTQIEPTLLNSLFPFQVDGVKFGVSKQGKCLIADEMGLGKTLQALAIADYYKDDWPLLIICPSSMRYQWQEEILKYLPQVPSYSVIVAMSGKDEIGNFKVLILSYDLLVKFKDFLKKSKCGAIIFDESHSLKSLKTQRTKAALEVAKKLKRIILLSGTPALSRPFELYPQIKVLNPNIFKEVHEFGVRYCDGKQDKFGWNFQGSSHLEELKFILEETFMIRRLKSNVLNQLPSKMRHVVTLSGDNELKKNKKMKKFESMLKDETNIKGREKRNTLLAYYAETGRAKIPAIINYLEDLLEQNKKFLCFAHHKEVLDAICELLEEKKVFYIRIDGSVNAAERKDVCDQFQDEDKFRVAVLSLTAANTGVTLTAAQLVVFAELFWNPGELIQAEDRAHRIGQKNCVFVQYLISKGTADDYLWPLVQSKLNVLNQAGLSKETQLSVEETKTEKIKQTDITQYFLQMDENVDEADLVSLLDEIEGVPEKKIKLT